MYQEHPLVDVYETGRQMHRIAWAWRGDLGGLNSMRLRDFFNMVKRIPYRPDPPGKEVIQRPWYTLRSLGTGGDCDDKAVVMGAWAHNHGVPFRFVAVSKSLDRDLHHVYTEFHVAKNIWAPVDPTYAFNVLGRPMANYPKRVILTR